MGTERRIVAVADTGPLIVLDELGSIDLLATVDELSIPETVLDELSTQQADRLDQSISHTRVTPPMDAVGSADIDAGERAALAVALDTDAVLLTDDLAARDAAERRDIEVHGTIGLVALAYARGRIDRKTAATTMRELSTETSLYVTEAVVEHGIELLDEFG